VDLTGGFPDGPHAGKALLGGKLGNEEEEKQQAPAHSEN
jgi:hypothetical protein